MNKIYIETSVGELIDKITILEIKKKKISDKKNLIEIDKEYSVLKESLEKNVKINDEIKTLWDELKETNLKLWGIEDEKRLAEKNKNFDKKFIELARNVYKFNDQRSRIKLKINNLTGSNIKEVKKYTEY
tara:strand:- start:1046 stop:1435 length:390 start_codon:yes stop_codon:yes gene_type:complete